MKSYNKATGSWFSGDTFADAVDFRPFAENSQKERRRQKTPIWLIATIFFALLARAAAFTEILELPDPSAEPTAEPTYSTTVTCPNDWTLFEGNCYLISGITFTNEACVNLCPVLSVGAEQLCVPDEETNTFLGILAGQQGTWIGYSDPADDGNFVWRAGCPSHYTNWHSGMPTAESTKQCVSFDGDGQWVNRPCGDYPYALCGCQMPAIEALPEPVAMPVAMPVMSPTSTPCPQNWMEYNGNCYHLASAVMTSDACAAYCPSQSPQAGQVCFPDEATHDFIVSTADTTIWLGFGDAANEGVFLWRAGCPVISFDRWARNQPSFDNTMNCVKVVNIQGGEWVTASCDTEQEKCACQMPIIDDLPEPVAMPTAMPVAVPTITPCLPEWMEYDGNCYFRSSEVMTSDACAAYCPSQSALAGQVCFSDEETNTFITSVVGATIWLGYGDAANEGNFVRRAGCPVSSYNNWDVDEPSSDNTLNCVQVLTDQGGVWVTASCETEQVKCACQMPTVLSSMRSSLSQSVKNGFAFAVTTSDLQALSWGEAQYGGDATQVVNLLQLGNVFRIVPSRFAFVAIMDSGSLVPWGAIEPPVDLTDPVVNLVCGEGACVGIVTSEIDARGIAFGAAGRGGDVSSTARCPGCATALATGVKVVTASAGAFAALKLDGTVFVWGNVHSGGYVSPSVLASLTGALLIVATRAAFAARLPSGGVVAWGCPFSGGDASAVQSQLVNVVHLVATRSGFAAIRADEGLVTWGYGPYGGDSSSVSVALSSGVRVVSHTFEAMAVLRADGSVTSWGQADSGGDSSSVQGDLTNVVRVIGNSRAFAALTLAGRVVAWGRAAYGGSIPADKLGALSSGVVALYATDRAFAALKGNGQLVVWGQAGHGGSPGTAVEALLTEGVHTVCANDVAFSAIKSDGSVVAWGHPVSVPVPGVQFVSSALTESATCAVNDYPVVSLSIR